MRKPGFPPSVMDGGAVGSKGRPEASVGFESKKVSGLLRPDRRKGYRIGAGTTRRRHASMSLEQRAGITSRDGSYFDRDSLMAFYRRCAAGRDQTSRPGTRAFAPLSLSILHRNRRFASLRNRRGEFSGAGAPQSAASSKKGGGPCVHSSAPTEDGKPEQSARRW
jgi:hypothetical protein